MENTAQTFANAVYWAVQNKDEFNIRVINCSFVIPLTDAAGAARSIADPLGFAVDMAIKAGIVIVAGVGNFGKEAGVGTPAGHTDVIAVGALDTAGTPGDHSDDKVPAFSSRGKSFTGESKPDVIAPGVRIMSLNVADSTLETRNAENLAKARLTLDGTSQDLRGLARGLIEEARLDPIAWKLPDEKLRNMVLRRFDVHPTEGEINGHAAYIAEDGSSMAAPWVSALCAHMFEANPDLTPRQVKQILMETAQPIPGVETEAQGRGAVQAQAAVAEAMRLRSA
jgi:subtilisin family serine protease